MHSSNGEDPERARKTAKSDRTRARLLEAGVDLLGGSGLSDLTLARLADEAGVTRGCVQYYFMTQGALVAALAGHIAERSMAIFEAAALAERDGDAIEFALGRVADLAGERYRKANLALAAAVGTDSKLQAALAKAATESETAFRICAARMTGDETLADSPRLRAGCDLAALVSDQLSSRRWPQERAAGVLFGLRIALSVLWGERDSPTGKLRVRVKAGTASPRIKR